MFGLLATSTRLSLSCGRWAGLEQSLDQPPRVGRLLPPAPRRCQHENAMSMKGPRADRAKLTTAAFGIPSRTVSGPNVLRTHRAQNINSSDDLRRYPAV